MFGIIQTKTDAKRQLLPSTFQQQKKGKEGGREREKFQLSWTDKKYRTQNKLCLRTISFKEF